jgi:riboflavin synthase
MFTGIINKTTKVKNIKSAKGGIILEVENKFQNKLQRVKLGDSININGVCSTVRKINKNLFFEYMPETLRLSNIGNLKNGDVVNLEQSMKLSDRLDGHIVLGHIDGVGKILNIKKEGNSEVFEIKIPDHKFMQLMVYKGSVAIEGISLTVTKVLKNSFVVKVLPYTLEKTNLRYKKTGDVVNLEFDILAKYAQKNNLSRSKF